MTLSKIIDQYTAQCSYNTLTDFDKQFRSKFLLSLFTAKESLLYRIPKRVFCFVSGKEFGFNCGTCGNLVNKSDKFCNECGQCLVFPETEFDENGKPAITWPDEVDEK